MLVSESINNALLDTHTSSDDYDPATNGLQAYNTVRNKVLNAVVNAKQDYFWDRITTSTVIGQTEYNIAQITGTPNLLIKKVDKAFIKYDGAADYYTPIEQIAPSLMEKDPDYYSGNQSEALPFFNIKDRSIFIYPAPTEVIAQGIKMNIVYHPAELALIDDDTRVDEDKQYIYALGIAEHIYKSQGKLGEADAARNDFDTELRSFITEIKNRYNQPIKKKFKNNLNSYR